jgi:hypothetical protein
MEVKIEPRDMWVGVYWTRVDQHEAWLYRLRVYVCLIPCVVIIWESKQRSWDTAWRLPFDPNP